MNCAVRPTSSPTWRNWNPSRAAIQPSARPRASRVIMRRSSCSARPRWRRGPMTTTSRIENNPGRGRKLPALLHSEPDRNCPLCPRLASFRNAVRAREPEWFNSPVPSFGDANAALLIVGLAPGVQGANRTGRPFTGDFAGDLLYATLLEFGLAEGEYRADPADGLRLKGAIILNAVKCLPPANKPEPSEIATCGRNFFEPSLAAL